MGYHYNFTDYLFEVGRYHQNWKAKSFDLEKF